MSGIASPERWQREPLVATNVRRLPATAVAAVPGVGPSVDIVGVKAADGWCHSADVQFQAAADDWDAVPYELVAYCGSIWLPIASGLLGDVRTTRVGTLATSRSGYLPPVRGRAFTQLVLRLYPPVLATPTSRGTFTIVAWGGDSPPAAADQAGPAVREPFSRPEQRWTFTATGGEIGAVSTVALAPVNPRGGRSYLTHLDIQPAGETAAALLRLESVLLPVRDDLQTIDLRSGPYREDLASPIVTSPGYFFRLLSISGSFPADIAAVNAWGFYD